MIPTYRYSVSSSSPIMMPFDLNEEDQSHNHNNLSSSASSLSYPVLFNPDQQDHLGGSYYWEEPKNLQSDEEAEKIIIPSRGSWDHQEAEKDENKSGLKLKIWTKVEDGSNENLQADDDGSVKWMSSKMRMMRRMMVPDQTGSGITSNSKKNKFEEEAKQPLSPLGTDDNSSNNSSNHSNNTTVRVCSDCHTTKTPLWRSGPRGPKSLCNACGIRQRKARRAMAAAAAAAAAASANGTIPMASEAYDDVVKGKNNKLNKKEKKKRKAECDDDEEPQMKKKRKLGGAKSLSHRGRKKFGFEDLTINLSKNLALQVFPQDEKEAAILLMALSYGMLHGFPSDRYLD